MDNLRSIRSARMIQLEIAKLIHCEIEDINTTGIITITNVKMSNNLKNAKIYISIMKEEKQAKKTFELLNNKKGFIRRHIGKILKLRYVPNIQFEFDKSISDAHSINKHFTEGIS